MNEFFTVEMTDDNGDPIRVTVRKSKVDSIQWAGKRVAVMLSGHQPITFNFPGVEESKTLYLKIGEEFNK